MKWFLIVFFAAGHQFIFTDPTFESLEECRFSANHPPHIAMYSKKLLQQYGYPQRVDRVACASEEDIKKILEFNKKLKEEKEKGIRL